MAKDFYKRLKSLQTSSPTQLKLLKAIQVAGVKEAAELESTLHRKFTHLRLSGEWFKAEKELLGYIGDLQVVAEATLRKQ